MKTRIALTALVVTATAWPCAAPRSGRAAGSSATAPAWFVNVAEAAGVLFRHTNGASASRHLTEIMSGVEIRWPSGTTDTLTAVAANQRINVTEGKGITARQAYVVK